MAYCFLYTLFDGILPCLERDGRRVEVVKRKHGILQLSDPAKGVSREVGWRLGSAPLFDHTAYGSRQGIVGT